MEAEERNYEQEAEEQGWNPDFDGPNKVDAKTFVERGEKIAGILKSKVERLEDKVNHLTESNKQFGEYHKKTLETQRKKAERRIEELEIELAQSITDGDGQAYTRTRKEIDGLKNDLPQESADNAWTQLSQSWVNDNRWYIENPKLAAYADGLADRIRAEGYDGQAYFSELTKRVKADFPNEFENPARHKANGVEAGGQKGSTDSKAHTYENLPADAKAACNDFVAQGFTTKEDYLKNYEWDE